MTELNESESSQRTHAGVIRRYCALELKQQVRPFLVMGFKDRVMTTTGHPIVIGESLVGGLTREAADQAEWTMSLLRNWVIHGLGTKAVIVIEIHMTMAKI
jgi:hypothetical protein